MDLRVLFYYSIMKALKEYIVDFETDIPEVPTDAPAGSDDSEDNVNKDDIVQG